MNAALISQGRILLTRVAEISKYCPVPVSVTSWGLPAALSGTPNPALLDTALFTVSRVPCDWEEREIIQREQKVIKVERSDELLEIAEHAEFGGTHYC